MSDASLYQGPLPQLGMEGIIAALKSGRADPAAIPRFDEIARQFAMAADRGEVDRTYAKSLLADYDVISGADAPGNDRRDRMLTDRYGRIAGLIALDQLATDAQQGNPPAGPRTVNPDGSPRAGVPIPGVSWAPGGVSAVAGVTPRAPTPGKPAAPASVTAMPPSSQPVSGSDFPGIAANAGVGLDPTNQTAVLGEHVGDTWRAFAGGARAAANDVAGGVVEAPLQAVQGVRNAAQAWLDFAEWAGDKVGSVLPQPGIDYSQRQLPVLPDVTHDPKTATGALVNAGAQWLASFGGAGKILGTLGEGADASQIAAKIFQSGLAGFLGFDPKTTRISDVFVKQFPQAKNAVTDWLSSNPDDNEATARFKTALETMGFGVVTDGVVSLLRAGRLAESVKPAEPSPAPAATPVVGLGATDEPAILTKRQANKKLQAAGTELDAGGRGAAIVTGAGDPSLTPIGAKGDIYVNWGAFLGRTDTDATVQSIIHDTAVKMKPEIDATRGGVQPHDVTIAKSGDVNAFDVLLNRRKGQPLAADEVVAAGALWKGAAGKLQELARKAAADPSPENLFAARQMMAVFYAIQKEVLGARADAGRGLDAWKLVGKGDATAQMTAILNAEGGLDTQQALMQKLAGINDLSVLSDVVDKSIYAKSRDAVQQVFYANILSGPKTHAANIISNTAMLGLHLVDTAVASGIGKLVGSDVAPALGEAWANVKGMVAGVTDAFRSASKTIATGESKFDGADKYGGRPRDAPAVSSTTWNLAQNSWGGAVVDTIGAVLSVPGRLLQGEDEFFKTVGARGFIYQQAFRQAQTEIAAGKLSVKDAPGRIQELVDHPPPDVDSAAAAQAAYLTLTTESGPLVQKLNGLRTQYPTLRFVLPFLQVPANAFKLVAEHSPIAPLMQRYQTAIAKGGADAYVAKAKIAVGSTTALMGLDWALSGNLTGSGPPPGAAREEWLRAGNKPYSIKVGDRWYAYNRIEPVGSWLGYAADLGEWLVNNPQADGNDQSFFDGALGAAVFSVAENATSKSYLKGVSDLADAVNDPSRFGQRYLESLLGAVAVPRIVTELSTAADPTLRATDGMFDELKSRTPWSQTLQPVRDVWGRPISYVSGLGAAYDTLSPVYSSKAAPQPVDAEMEKDGWFIGMPPKNWSINGGRARLTEAQYSEYLGLQGQTKASALPGAIGSVGTGKSKKPVTLADRYGNATELEALNALVGSDAYRSLKDPSDRENAIRAVVGDYRDAARATMLVRYPQLGLAAGKEKANRYTTTAGAEVP